MRLYGTVQVDPSARSTSVSDSAPWANQFRLLAAPGVGLAATQVDVQLRVIVMKIDNQLYTLANPEMVRASGEQIGYEGCLSVPNLYGKVPRYEKVKVKALDLSGKEFRVTAEGFLARIFQHEIDHTNGKVFIDHIKDKPEAFFRLDKDGKLQSIDYDTEVENNHDLWPTA